MRTPKLLLIAGLVALFSPAIGMAVTPHLDNATITSPSTNVDLINTTGSGKLLAIQCTNTTAGQIQAVAITVDGGTTITLYVSGANFPVDQNKDSFSGWIPLELSFSSSLHVQLQRGSSPAFTWTTYCSASWND